MNTSVDFATVQYARKLTALTEPLAVLTGGELSKVASLLQGWAGLKDAGAELTGPQLVVLFQGLRTKELIKLEAVKGGVQVEFAGGGFEYERFLLRSDGRMPNHRYEAKKMAG